MLTVPQRTFCVNVRAPSESADQDQLNSLP